MGVGELGVKVALDVEPVIGFEYPNFLYAASMFAFLRVSAVDR